MGLNSVTGRTTSDSLSLLFPQLPFVLAKNWFGDAQVLIFEALCIMHSVYFKN